jgi:hypothetical protein
MNRLILAMTLTAVLTASAFVSRAASPSDRPPGVAPQDWVQLTAQIGFVIVHDKSHPVVIGDMTGLFLTPPTPGYFMLKGPAGWSRVVVVEPIKGPAAAG